MITIDNLTIDPLTRTVTRGDQQIELTKQEFALLLFLAENNNKTLSRNEILTMVWGGAFSFSNVVDVHICFLRKKIDVEPHRPIIHTIRGAGYSIGVRL